MGAGAGHAWVDDVASLEGLRSFGDRGSLGEVGVLGLLWDRRLILALPLRLGALGSAAPQLLVPTGAPPRIFPARVRSSMRSRPSSIATYRCRLLAFSAFAVGVHQRHLWG